MGPKIALLLNGSPDDLSASVCAVQLAARAESSLYAIQELKPSGSTLEEDNLAETVAEQQVQCQESFRFVTEFAEAEDVPISCHFLGVDTFGKLDEFLISHDISCLVLHCESETCPTGRPDWLAALQERLYSSPKRYHQSLQIIVAPPMSEAELERTMAQFRKLKALRGNKK